MFCRTGDRGNIDSSAKSREKQQLMTFEVKETGLLYVAGPLLCPLTSQPAGQTCRHKSQSVLKIKFSVYVVCVVAA